jgi:hypothetical protein
MRIEGLTEHQVELLDTMWAIDEFDDLEDWMQTLSKADRVEAENLQRLVILETLEEMLEQSKYPDANKVIDRFRLTR